MKRQMAGYTILEVMIFLAVSGILFAVVFPAFNDSQDKVRFTQSVQDLQNKINDVINDVGTGYFPSGDVKCSVTASAAPVLTQPAVTDTDIEQGTRNECVFLGKVIGFNGGVAKPTMNIFTVVGRKQDVGGTDVRTLLAAQPRAVANSTTITNRPDIMEAYPIKWSMEINKVVVIGSRAAPHFWPEERGSFAVMSSLSTTGIVNTKQVDIIPVDDTTISPELTNSQHVDQIDDNGWDDYNPSNGILVCVKDPKTKQRAAVLVGGTAGEGKTKVTFDKVAINFGGTTNLRDIEGVQGICT